MRKGQTLAILDPTDYKVSYTQSLAQVQNTKAQIENALAQLENAKANYISAQSNYKRFESLFETNSISLSDFEQAKSTYQSAQAAYKAAKTQVEAAKASNESSESVAKSASNQVNYTRLFAPFSGVITRKLVEENEILAQGSPIIEINSIGKSDVEVGVPETDISKIKAGQKVLIQFNSLSDKDFNATVHEIGYSSSGSTYPVTLSLLENDVRIRPGMPATALFTFTTEEKTSVLLVPSSAVGEDSNGNFVYKIESKENNYVCKKQTISIGDLKDSGFEVLSGLHQGEKVASAGLNVLRDGMLVSLFENK